uniref:Uncharacterized protein n=1 Tax=Arundo donax TaxID=35708 RepID=A0A0A8YVY6_ARUDO
MHSLVLKESTIVSQPTLTPAVLGSDLILRVWSGEKKTCLLCWTAEENQ